MQMPKQGSLKGRRVLVVEDELLVALDYVQNLESSGAEVVGPFQTAKEAMRCVADASIDAPVVDYALADCNSEGLQTALERGEIPFLVITAYPRVLVRRSQTSRCCPSPSRRASFAKACSPSAAERRLLSG